MFDMIKVSGLNPVKKILVTTTYKSITANSLMRKN